MSAPLIDLTAAIEAAAQVLDGRNSPWGQQDNSFLIGLLHEKSTSDAKVVLAAAFPLVRDAIAAAIDAINYHNAMTEKQNAYDCGLDEAARLVRSLTVTE